MRQLVEARQRSYPLRIVCLLVFVLESFVLQSSRIISNIKGACACPCVCAYVHMAVRFGVLVSVHVRARVCAC